MNLEVIDTVKLLKIQVSDSLKLDKNTGYLCHKAKTKIYLLRSIKRSGLTQELVKDAYKKEVR